MNALGTLISRNTKLFFRDKGLFFTSLITPVILLVLYITFLGNIYKESIVAIIDASAVGVTLPNSILDGFAGGQLVSSILSVSCITVAVSCNMLMVQDKVTGVCKDISISPIKPHVLALSYYISTLISTFIVCFAALGVSLVYLAAVGFYLSVLDVLLIALDVVILVCLGTAFSSVINFFLSSQGQISAVGSIISSCYGFICGAYMPISQFAEGLRNVVGILPGTYGTSLLRRHALRSVTEEMAEAGLPDDVIHAIRDMSDYHIYVFDREVPVGVMYAVLIGTVALLVGIYVFMNILRTRKAKKQKQAKAQI